MQNYYGGLNILRALDEAEFWKHQEAEHADLIPLVTPNLEPQYAKALSEFALALRNTQTETIQYIEAVNVPRRFINREMRAQIAELINRCREQTEQFISLMEEILQGSHASRASQPSQVVINHMIRESRYFLGQIQ